MELKTLFSPKKIGNVQIKNRIVRSATFMHVAEKYGFVGERLLKMYEELATGGTGLIITGAAAVDPSGTGGPYQMVLYDESHIPGNKKLVKLVHEYDDTKIAVQIQHSGRQGVHPKYPTVAPSPVPNEETGITPRGLTTVEVKDFTKKFVETSIMAYECGYDMVQLHSAHGYFLNNFLSPFTNQRTDEFGVDLNGRTKILRDIHDGIRDQLGKKFPIIIKFQSIDLLPNRITEEAGIEISMILSNIGFDAIEPSGTPSSKIVKRNEQENYFLPNAKKMKPHLKDCALLLVGGVRNPLSAERILKEGEIDFISLSRPLIYEPDLPNRWKNGDLTPAKCISCNSCFSTMNTGTYCVTRKNLEEKK
ncbi:hypothetical protein LCGC14_0942920 [marine sediment metagenome]|uniref:NADH:flavin oxidoreductase/NADH oxidase N-terminal domain-containing protein n=1 Tax=marine sediment metagenome TaxID=412755 RepID=A0A0F9NJI4_9ZZZZ